MSIVIALVAEKNGRITEIAEVKGKTLKTANLILKKFEPTVDDRKCYEENGYYFCVLAANGTVYLCASSSSGNQRLSFQFLETVKNEYEDRGYHEKEDITRLEDYIEEQMDTFSNHPEKVDKLKELQYKVNQVKEVQLSNLGKLLDREEKLEHIQDRVDVLNQQANQFHVVAKKLKCIEWRRNIVVTIVLLICCVILIGVIAGIIYYVVK